MFMLWEQLASIPVWGLVIEIAIIIVFKIIEVAIGTVRGILIVKGFRKIGVFLSIFEILLWVFIASRVITGLADEPLKGIAYSIGFASGVYIGSLIEQRLAFGMLMIQIITNVETEKEIATKLRDRGYGVTSVNAEGRSETRKILMVFANRYGSHVISEDVQQINPQAVVVVSDISSLKGGFISKRRSIMK